MKPEFENIAAYDESQFRDALLRVLDNVEFHQIVEGICHYQLNDACKADDIIRPLYEVHTQEELDQALIITGLKHLADKACNGLILKGKENLRLPSLFLTNHRDIIMDAAFLSVLIKDETGKRIFFGAGTNLYVQSWVEDMLRMNNGFAVIRGGTVHEMIRNSGQLSAYIRYLLSEQKAGVWLAQREGRAKNSDDRTQPALLKMLALSGEGDFISKMQQLNITPLSISYEYDPCDYLKAQEMQLKRDNPAWKKSPQDDFLSMRTGMLGYKGQTVFTITPSVNPELDEIGRKTSNRNEQVQMLAETIDNHIHKNYHIYNVNRIAYDLYLNEQRFVGEYTTDEKNAFMLYIKSRIDKVQIENKDEAFLQAKILEMYANPLINQINAKL